MEIMTEEEAFALDEYYTNNPPKADPSKARIRIPIWYVLTAAPLKTCYHFPKQPTKRRKRLSANWYGNGLPLAYRRVSGMFCKCQVDP
jgi:hypothetical protein